MNCPKCKGYHLKPQKLDNGLVALSCDNCHGALLSIVQFIQWRETQKEMRKKVDSICEIDETSQMLYCPKCSGFMTKYKISNHTHNRLDLCFACYETWIDLGEWQLLQQLDLHLELDTLFSSKWQDKILAQTIKQRSHQRIKSHFGVDYEKIQTFKTWIETFDKKSDVIDYLKSHKE